MRTRLTVTALAAFTALVGAYCLTSVSVVAADGPAAGTIKVNPKDGSKYVWIPPGSFQMGCSTGDDQCFSDEKPTHHVVISKGFWLGQTPVTVAAYQKFVESTGGRMPRTQHFNADWKNPQNPIIDVSYANGLAYSKWIGGRLPTEAEWEYAARAGNTSARYGPIDEIAWYGDNSGAQHLDSSKLWAGKRRSYLQQLYENKSGTHDVAQKRPNAWGLYDMLGNVWQYTADNYGAKYYASAPERDPKGPAEADPAMQYVLRGGSWVDVPQKIRVSYRDGYPQGFQIGIDGFRSVWEEAAQ